MPVQPTSTDVDGDSNMLGDYPSEANTNAVVEKATSIPVEPACGDSTMRENRIHNVDEEGFVPRGNEIVFQISTAVEPVEPTDTHGNENVNMLEASNIDADQSADQDGNIIMHGSTDVEAADSSFETADYGDMDTHQGNKTETQATMAIVPVTSHREEPASTDPCTAIESTNTARFNTGDQEGPPSESPIITSSGDENLKGTYWRRGFQQTYEMSQSTLINAIWRWSALWTAYNADSHLPYVFVGEYKGVQTFLFTYDCKDAGPLEDCRLWYLQSGNHDEGVVGVFKNISFHDVLNPSNWYGGTIFFIGISDTPDPGVVYKTDKAEDVAGGLFLTVERSEGIEEEL